MASSSIIRRPFAKSSIDSYRSGWVSLARKIIPFSYLAIAAADTLKHFSRGRPVKQFGLLQPKTSSHSNKSRTVIRHGWSTCISLSKTLTCFLHQESLPSSSGITRPYLFLVCDVTRFKDNASFQQKRLVLYLHFLASRRRHRPR